MKNLKILLIGNYSAYYRSELWVMAAIEEKYNLSFATRKYYGYRSRFNRLIGYVLFTLELAVKLCFADIVVLLPMNHNSIFQLLFMRKLLNYKLISDLYISAYDTAIDREMIKRKSNAKYKKILDRLIIEQSDKLIHFSKFELRYIAKKVGAKIEEQKYWNVPLSVPTREFLKQNPSELFSVCWWGTYVPLHGIEQILECVRIMKNKGNKIKFFLFGIDTQEKNRIASYIKEHHLQEILEFRTDCTFSNGLLFDQLKNNCDLALGSFGKSEKAKNVITNKVIDASSLGLPVLTMPTTVTKEYFGDLFFYCSNEPEEMATEIIKISTMNLSTRKELIYKHFLENYSTEITKRSMKLILT